LRRAARERAIELEAAWLVGDILDDVEAGRRAGCRTILLNRGGETEWRLGPQRIPHHIAHDLYSAARLILSVCGSLRGSGPSRRAEREAARA
ncbi:MAG TPA: HAD hydrolase-like protein, partial [Gammaproteobacteria bacterium]|nr:HAD hydrolase-like protein [Gammaproteobacteria bacterium]